MTEHERMPPAKPLETAVAVHLIVLVVGVTWAFGGNADWVRTPIAAWGSLGIALSIISVFSRGGSKGSLTTPFTWAAPVVVLNAVVALSSLTPGFRSLIHDGSTYFMPVSVPGWIPSAARPGLALRELWLFDGLYFSCFNLVLIVRKNSILRTIVGAAVANALALAIFGTVQKLVGSTGIYFGAVKSTQDYFFASFVYDNHWAAFIILMTGACAGLVIRYLNGVGGGGFFKGPSLLGIVAAFLLSITVPFSGARACTILLSVLICLSVVKGAPKLMRILRGSEISRARSSLALVLVACCAICAAWLIAGDVIEGRVEKARQQVGDMWAQRAIGSRSILYHDTWAMAMDRPVFGWGMGSYPSVFSLYNTQISPIDRIPVVYHDAHSDWLQTFAELGWVGALLVGLAVAIPGASVRRLRPSSLPFFLFAGCLLVGAYAWVEFPFGNVAVELSWWLCFFSAIQYMRLTRIQGLSRKSV